MLPWRGCESIFSLLTITIIICDAYYFIPSSICFNKTLFNSSKEFLTDSCININNSISDIAREQYVQSAILVLVGQLIFWNIFHLSYYCSRKDYIFKNISRFTIPFFRDLYHALFHKVCFSKQFTKIRNLIYNNITWFYGMFHNIPALDFFSDHLPADTGVPWIFCSEFSKRNELMTRYEHIHWLMRSHTHSLTYALNRSLSHSRVYALTHS